MRLCRDFAVKQPEKEANFIRCVQGPAHCPWFPTSNLHSFKHLLNLDPPINMCITAALFDTPGCNHRCTHAKGGHVVTTQSNPFSKKTRFHPARNMCSVCTDWRGAKGQKGSPSLLLTMNCSPMLQVGIVGFKPLGPRANRATHLLEETDHVLVLL